MNILYLMTIISNSNLSKLDINNNYTFSSLESLRFDS